MNSHNNNKNKQPSTAEKAGQPSTAEKAGQPSTAGQAGQPSAAEKAVQPSTAEKAVTYTSVRDLMAKNPYHRTHRDRMELVLTSLKNGTLNPSLLEFYINSYEGDIDSIFTALGFCRRLEVLILNDACYFHGDRLPPLCRVLPSLSLVELNLEWNRIGDSGVQQLVDALSGTKTLEVLNLVHNMIGPTGAASLASLLTTNDTLVELNLGGNMLRDQGTQYIAEGLLANTTLRRFKIPNNYITKDIERYLFPVLVRRGCISYLDLGSNQIDWDAIPLPIQEIDLTYLNISKNSTKFSQMQNMPMLEILDISENQVTPSGVTAIVNTFMSPTCLVSRLNISSTHFPDVAKLSIILTIPTFLTKLDLSKNLICENDAKALGKALETNTSLEELNLDNCKLEDTGGCAIANGLIKNTSLIALNLMNNELGPIVLFKLCKSKVQKLNFSWNKLPSLDHIKKALAESSLDELDLYACDIDTQGAVDIVSGFKGKVLNIGANEITDDGAIAIATAIGPDLKELNIGNNPLGNLGVEKFARKMLEPDCHITNFSATGGIPGLDSYSPISNDVGKIIAQNTKLEDVDGDFDNQEITHQVAQNCTKNLNIRMNTYLNIWSSCYEIPEYVQMIGITMYLLMPEFKVKLPMRLIPYIMSFKTYGAWKDLI